VSESYVAEKLWCAVDMLAGKGPIRERLTDAATGALVRLNPEDFRDVGDREAFGQIMARFRDFQAIGEEGDIAASAQLLTETQAHELAEAIRGLQREYPFP
jgi:hypothetical protein